MAPPDLVLPELVRPERPDPGVLRRRSTLLALGLGLVLLALLLLWSLGPGSSAGHAVVIDAPDGSRLAVDGEPQPVLGRDGTHLLTLDRGSHLLEITLRSGQVVEHELQVEGGEGSLMVQLRWDKVYRRWTVQELRSSP